jgi:hypothetical protein
VREVDEIGLQADLLGLLEAFAFGCALGAHIANGAQRVERAIEQNRGQANLHGKFRAIFALADQMQANAHGARAGGGEIALPVGGVSGTIARGKHLLERLADEFPWGIAKECTSQLIDQRDGSGLVDEHQGIGRDVQEWEDSGCRDGGGQGCRRKRCVFSCLRVSHRVALLGE